MRHISTDLSETRNLSTNLCFVPDKFLEEKSRWVARLSNGQTVYQDDGRPNCNPPSAWLRLGEYIRQNKLSILELSIQFRRHIESPLPKCMPGYFFCHKSVTVHGANRTVHFFQIGTLTTDGHVCLQLWKIPELVFCGHSVRIPEECKDMLILGENYYERFVEGTPG